MKIIFIKQNISLKRNFDGITIFTDSPNLINKGFYSLHSKVKIDQGGETMEVFCECVIIIHCSFK